MSTHVRIRRPAGPKVASKAMLKSDLLTPKAMVEATGGYAELQPVASGPPATADLVAAKPECGVDCERERAVSSHPPSGRPRQRRRRAAQIQ